MRRRYAANAASKPEASPALSAATHARSSASTERQRTTSVRVTQQIMSHRRASRVVPHMLDFFRAGGFSMIPLTVVGLALVVTAIKFARNADPQRLSLIRALTVTIAFITIIGTAAGLASTAHFVAEQDDALKTPLPYLLQGFAETMT